MTYPIGAAQAYFTVAESALGKRVALTGPFPSHAAAAADLDRARAVVRAKYPNDTDAHFASYGVVLATSKARVAFPGGA